MDQYKTPKRPLIVYFAIFILAIFLFNMLLMPLLTRTPETTYDDFLSKLEAGQVKVVQMSRDTEEILFQTEEDGKTRIYSLGQMEDGTALTQRLEGSGVKFGAVIPQQPSMLGSILSWLLPIVVMLLGSQLLFRSLQKRMGGPNSMQFGKSSAKVYVSAQTGIRFADVAGEDEAKEALGEIVDFLHNPDKYKEIGAAMPKGALLVGPPGTGKTLLAKAVAGEADVPFFSISGSEFVEMFVGMGAARVRDLFKQAQEKAPCIVFIDEIDTIGKKRDGGGMTGNDEREQTLNQLLTEMDGFSSDKGVVILAATNRPESLDPALLRPGRFDRRVPVELPDLQGREAILRVHARKVKLAPEADLHATALATAGASGAELANIINEAALHAVRLERKAISQADLDEAVETVIAGYQRKGAVIPEKQKRIVAYHEIGHALVAARQSDSAPVHKITIVPRTSGALGYTMQVEQEETVLMSREEAFNKIATFTGGRSAEELVFGTYTSGASNDIEQATKLARAMVARLGMSERFDMTALETVGSKYLGGDASLTCSEQTAAQVDQEVIALIKSAHRKALGILEENRAKLDELASFLLERETITGEEFMEILNSPAQ
ncbi:MAG: ATP-dependent zinc metalloprotease FtsH [Oscillospiraceae bacterium]|jgi:cell division protease FtsH|nr:ATP-dependent zinc metalloprotease FtsH [Oscillospiraceae bacterium]